MSYTNSELVRNHLVTSLAVSPRIYDQMLILTGDEYRTFFGGAVENDSLLVQSLQSNDLTRLTITLAEPVTVLPASAIVRGSVVLASDSSLGIIYIENRDFVIDYAAGEITIKEGSQLTAGQQATIWYLPCYFYSVGSDYQIDADRGRIRRLTSSEIVSGETVFIDYTPVCVQITDEIVANAVSEANGLIEREVDPDRQFGADFVLQAAATSRALDIVCRTAAARELSSFVGSDRTATGWMKLADHYARRSEQLLSSFRPPAAAPKPPTRS